MQEGGLSHLAEVLKMDTPGAEMSTQGPQLENVAAEAPFACRAATETAPATQREPTFNQFKIRSVVQFLLIRPEDASAGLKSCSCAAPA